MKLLNVNENTKTIKNNKFGILTGILYLAPANVSTYEVCESRSIGCTKSCLFYAGHATIFKKINSARIRKTKMFFEHRNEFFSLLNQDIEALERKAIKLGMIPAVRLNGTSDIRWEDIQHEQNPLQKFPHIRFYDYTKHDVIDRLKKIKAAGIQNYDLTFSLSETKISKNRAIQAIKNNVRVAFVYNKFNKPEFNKKITWNNISALVVDGDNHDARFIDPPQSFVALKAKGRARKETLGFTSSFIK